MGRERKTAGRSPFSAHPLFCLLPVVFIATSFAAEPTKLRLSVNEPLTVQLALGLGAFAQEGLEIEIVKVESVAKEDYLIQRPLVEGKLDASFHWFQHVVFGARHHLPLKAVMMIADTPNLTIVVANRVKDQIKSAADFKGRNIAEGVGYATKSLITNYLAHRAGLPRDSYTAVLKESDGRREAVLKGLAEDRVDVLSFMEPMTSAILDTKKVTVLYDLATRAGTVKAFGAPWPSHSVFLSAAFIAKNPDTVQRLVNALVRARRFAESHTPEEIAARLPPSFFANGDRAAALDRIRQTRSGYAHGNYAFTPDAVKLVADAILWSKFDSSEEGIFRAGGDKSVRYADLYDNRFVEKAMKEIK